MRLSMYFSVSPNAPTRRYLHQVGHQHGRQFNENEQLQNLFGEPSLIQAEVRLLHEVEHVFLCISAR